MGVLVQLATSGVVGVTGLTSGQLNSSNDGDTVAVNTVYALTGTDGFTILLPEPGVNEDFSGMVIYFKNLMDDVGMGATNRVDINPGNTPVDGDSTLVPFTITRNEPFSFWYINETVGWIMRM